jgi:hypothetical protein
MMNSGNACGDPGSPASLADMVSALGEQAESFLKRRLYEEALDAAELLLRLTPGSQSALSLLDRGLQGLLDWQSEMRIESAKVNATLRRMAQVRAQIVSPGGRERGEALRASSRAPGNPLQEIASRYNPTKCKHDYIRHYWRHFQELRYTAKKVCEIGVSDQPGEKIPNSLMMWEEFFPNATVYGLDINQECYRAREGRREIHIGDQGDPEFLQRFIKETGGEFDVIIDDGAHTTEAILTSFTWLFGALTDHGMYVIEDITFQRPVQQFLLDLADGLNYWPAGFPLPDWPHLHRFEQSVEWVRKNIVGMAFYRYICFIMRGFNPEDNAFLTPKP